MSTMRIDVLSLWWSIGSEAMELRDTVERLPDICECDDAEAHLDGRCRCCNGHEPMVEGPAREESCRAIIARLQTDLTILANDFDSADGPHNALSLMKSDVELRQGIFLAVCDLQEVLEALRRINEVVSEFRENCKAIRMDHIRRHCMELLEACRRINRKLLGEHKDEGRDGSRSGLPHAA
jgi:hypothetical protein